MRLDDEDVCRGVGLLRRSYVPPPLADVLGWGEVPRDRRRGNSKSGMGTNQSDFGDRRVFYCLHVQQYR